VPRVFLHLFCNLQKADTPFRLLGRGNYVTQNSKGIRSFTQLVLFLLSIVELSSAQSHLRQLLFGVLYTQRFKVTGH